MELNEKHELILDQDAEVDAVHFLANYLASRKIDARHTVEAYELAWRVGEIIMGNSEGSFEKPHVPLSASETKLVLATAYNYIFGLEDNYDKLPPNVKRKIDELAEVGEQYFSE